MKLLLLFVCYNFACNTIDVFLRRTRSGNEEQAKTQERDGTDMHTHRALQSELFDSRHYIQVIYPCFSAGEKLGARPSLPLPRAPFATVRNSLPALPNAMLCVREKAEIYLIRMPNVVQPLHTFSARLHGSRCICDTHRRLTYTHTLMPRIHARRRFPNPSEYTRSNLRDT